jgi:predicted AAA+ superfamily ATPase
MIQRQIISAIAKQIRKFPIVAVTGPRQSGKTTLLTEQFPEYRYISLEDIANREFAEQDPNAFLQEYSNKVIIDEAQRAPQLFSYLQTKTDLSKKAGQYILSGSQNFLLLEKISQSLAGRVALFHLLPFSVNELSDANKLPASLEKIIFTGFYPRVHHKKIDPSVFYRDYTETYIERDVRTITAISDISRFRNFVRLCAGRIGQVLNLQSLANDAGISQPTANAWLSILETSFIAFRLPPYFNNFNKRIIKSPKLYFYDTGLACYLLGITDYKQIKTHYLKGGLFENLVINELQKSVYNQNRTEQFYFWRDNHGNELDLVWQEGARLNRLEVKYGETFSSSFATAFQRFSELPKVPNGNQWLVLGNHPMQKRSEFQVTGWQNLQEII